MRLLAQARLPVRGTAALLLFSAALLLTRSTPALAFTAAPRALSVLSFPRRAGRLLSQARMASTGAAAAGGPSVSSTAQRLRTLETLNFDNLAIRSLPVDPETGNFIRQGEHGLCVHLAARGERIGRGQRRGGAVGAGGDAAPLPLPLIRLNNDLSVDSYMCRAT
jgi:hypothetical protein